MHSSCWRSNAWLLTQTLTKLSPRTHMGGGGRIHRWAKLFWFSIPIRRSYIQLVAIVAVSTHRQISRNNPKIYYIHLCVHAHRRVHENTYMHPTVYSKVVSVRHICCQMSVFLPVTRSCHVSMAVLQNLSHPLPLHFHFCSSSYVPVVAPISFQFSHCASQQTSLVASATDNSWQSMKSKSVWQKSAQKCRIK